MNVTAKYNIPFFGLKEGKHVFDFEIEREFFEYYNNPEIETGELTVNVELYKQPGLLELGIIIRGTVKLQCDRCLDYFNMPLNYDGKLYVKFGEEKEDLDENVIVLKENTHSLNLAQFLYEYIHLSLPYKRVHRDAKDCNKEMLKRLGEHSFNEESTESIDPRWKGLNELNNETKN